MSDIFFPDIVPKKVVYICPICSHGNISYGECTNCNPMNVKEVSNVNNQNQTKPSGEVQEVVQKQGIKRKRRNKNRKKKQVISSKKDGSVRSQFEKVEKEIAVKF